jgi:steroid 5-alpha reductase family enzyme
MDRRVYTLPAVDDLPDRALSAHFEAHNTAELDVCSRALSLHLRGVFSLRDDAQKFFVLQLRKGVIQDGLFARTRNPNYLGEVLTYGGLTQEQPHFYVFALDVLSGIQKAVECY